VADGAGVNTWSRGIGPGRRFDEGGPTAHGPAGGRLPRCPGPWGGDRGGRAHGVRAGVGD
jgi:hypothetical protein